MGKDSGKKPKGLLKLNLPLDDTGPKRKRDRRSLLGDGDYNFGSPTEPSEWSKLYLGQPSFFDDTDPAEEYSKTAKADKEKHPAAKSKSFLDDDYGQDFVVNEQLAVPIPSLPPEPQRPPLIQATARPIVPVTATSEEDEAKYLALRLAEDFAKRENIVLIGGAPYTYNGKFYSLLHDDEAQRMFFADNGVQDQNDL